MGLNLLLCPWSFHVLIALILSNNEFLQRGNDAVLPESHEDLLCCCCQCIQTQPFFFTEGLADLFHRVMYFPEGLVGHATCKVPHGGQAHGCSGVEEPPPKQKRLLNTGPAWPRGYDDMQTPGQSSHYNENWRGGEDVDWSFIVSVELGVVSNRTKTSGLLRDKHCGGALKCNVVPLLLYNAML